MLREIASCETVEMRFQFALLHRKLPQNSFGASTKHSSIVVVVVVVEVEEEIVVCSLPLHPGMIPDIPASAAHLTTPPNDGNPLASAQHCEMLSLRRYSDSKWTKYPRCIHGHHGNLQDNSYDIF